MDNRFLYNDCIAITKYIAKEKGIMWEQEQADILYECINGNYLDDYYDRQYYDYKTHHREEVWFGVAVMFVIGFITSIGVWLLIP